MSLVYGLLLGLPLGALGSLTGIGGGFLLMPILLFLFPQQSQGALSLVTLTVVFFNALSGTILSARQDRVHFRTGLLYGLLSLPLVWVGTQWQALIDRHLFVTGFGVFLLAGATFLVLKPQPVAEAKVNAVGTWVLGAGISLVIGLLSGFFGVGGGFLFVPLLAFVLRYPLAEATATSQMIVGLGSAWALTTGALSHPLPIDSQLLAGLVAGVLVGSPWGSWAAGRWSATLVLRILAGLLAVAGLRLLWSSW